MTEVTVHSDFGAQGKKTCYCLHFPPIYLAWSDRTACHDLFWMLRFKPAFSLSSFTFRRGSLVPLHFLPLEMVSFAYLRLLIFLPAILIPACDSSSLTFHMIYAAYTLNKQGDSMQAWHTPFPILNQSVVPHLVHGILGWVCSRFGANKETSRFNGLFLICFSL